MVNKQEGAEPEIHAPISLSQIPQQTWTLLRAATSETAHPFRTAVLATADQCGPQARTVILRNIDQERQLLECHTDSRSAKIKQLEDNDSVCWIFYDATQKIQVRALGTARVHRNNDYSQQCWSGLNDHQKHGYAQTLPPGKIISPAGAHPPVPGFVEMEAGRKNFSVISSRVHEFEWLQLDRAGHRRALAVYADQRWSVRWLMP